MDKVMQVSVFSENKPGRIEKITSIFAEEGINILAIAITSTNGFGIIKLLVDKYELAYEKLKQSGFTATLNEVLAIEMRDSPGGLYEVSHILSKNGINIENAYVYVVESRARAFLLVEVRDIEKAKGILSKEDLKFFRYDEFKRA
ncbi:MAG: ACT domain-containing protein [Dissulfurispiraceae bacterium]|jgi:hypothetical protein